MALLAAVAALAVRPFDPTPPHLSGTARVVDGDTLRLGGERIRLVGLDAPELAQDCGRADGTRWPCGVVARDTLATMVHGAALDCAPQGHDVYGRVLARCSAGGDLGARLVEAGMAISDGDYLGEEAAAKASRAGIWQGDFEAPAAWRAAHGEGRPAPAWLGWLRQWFD